jgi:hypothetical protein
MNKQQIETMINEMETKLEEAKEDLVWNRGAIKDSVMLVIPMLQDQLKIMRAMLTLEAPAAVIPGPQIVTKSGPFIMSSNDGQQPIQLGWTEKDTQVAAGLYPERIFFFSEMPGDDDG